ncbi:hypothetical protein EAG_06503 [Camponotus floridanus]|uniref:Uncharacterized protein n=1 Tax=Camponotus floridanus TaxID=104421 RepID=E1ZYG2_CAMFO|nr:hypothetical protein EAG_06503 [Camponotus floridanus]
MTSISTSMSIRGMPPARAIIHYLTTSHVFPAHLSHPDVQRTVRVRQAGGGVEVQRRLVKFLTDGNQMSDICKKYFLRDLYRKIDGAVLTSQNERELDCAITFQTHSILQRFMLRFDQLQLDCNDHLYIYDGAHAVGSYKGLPSQTSLGLNPSHETMTSRLKKGLNSERLHSANWPLTKHWRCSLAQRLQ